VVKALVTGAEGTQPGFKKNSLCSPGSEWVPDSLQSWKVKGGEDEEWHPHLSYTVSRDKLAL